MKISCLNIRKVISSLVLSLVLLFVVTVNCEAQALSLESIVTGAGKSFVSSILDKYGEESEDTYRSAYKSVENTIAELSKEVKKASNPKLKPEERSKILQKIARTQDSLGDYAKNFSNLADQTDKYNDELQESLQGLVANISGQFKNRFTAEKDSLSSISKAIGAIADDTKLANSNNVDNFFDEITGHINTLNKVSQTASKLLKTFAG